MITYKAITPSAPEKGMLDNEGQPVVPFNRFTCGIRFEGGVAVFGDASPGLKRTGLTAKQAATKMVQDFGYEVFEVNMVGGEEKLTPFVIEPIKAKPAAAPKNTAAPTPAGG